MNDEELHRLLRQHPFSLPLPSAFEREVWSRIEADDLRSLSSILAELLRRMLTPLSRPAMAFATILLFGAVGAMTGAAMVKSTQSSQGESAYLETVNPLVRAHSEGEP